MSLLKRAIAEPRSDQEREFEAEAERGVRHRPFDSCAEDRLLALSADLSQASERSDQEGDGDAQQSSTNQSENHDADGNGEGTALPESPRQHHQAHDERGAEHRSTCCTVTGKDLAR